MQPHAGIYPASYIASIPLSPRFQYSTKLMCAPNDSFHAPFRVLLSRKHLKSLSRKNSQNHHFAPKIAPSTPSGLHFDRTLSSPCNSESLFVYFAHISMRDAAYR